MIATRAYVGGVVCARIESRRTFHRHIFGIAGGRTTSRIRATDGETAARFSRQRNVVFQNACDTAEIRTARKGITVLPPCVFGQLHDSKSFFQRNRLQHFSAARLRIQTKCIHVIQVQPQITSIGASGSVYPNTFDRFRVLRLPIGHRLAVDQNQIFIVFVRFSRPI